jgi:solute carrier family 25 phosphate transporter 23/24/25/41
MAKAAETILIATSPQEKKLSTIQHLGVGFIGGTLSRTITSPLDVVKMLMQVSSRGGSAKETITKLLKEEGIAGFWRGNMAACVRLGPQSAIKFYAYDQLVKNVLHGKQPVGFQRTLFGSLSGVISQVLTYPLDVIRTRITVYPGKYTGIFNCATTMVSEEGIQSLFAGIIPTIMGVIPYEGAQFYAYGGLKNFYQTKIAPGKPISPFTNSLIGAAAGMFSQTFSYPFDVIRKRMMLKDENGKPLYNGMMDAFKTVIEKDGVAGLYRGVGINLIKVVPYAALQFTIVEETRKAFFKLNDALAKNKQPAVQDKKKKK